MVRAPIILLYWFRRSWSLNIYEVTKEIGFPCIPTIKKLREDGALIREGRLFDIVAWNGGVAYSGVGAY